MKPYWERDGIQVFLGDCREVLPTRGPVDAIVCDPPYGLGFMGKGWDHGVPGVEFWEAALRIVKPGAHLLAFGGTRTFHRLAVAIEDAGWEIRDTIMWTYGSGFPKSLDVSKAIDKAAGAEREVVGPRRWAGRMPNGGALGQMNDDSWVAKTDSEIGGDTAPATDLARQWDGWGTALKPAWEPIIVARKPLSGTVAANVLRYGTGGINVDGCRIGHDEPEKLTNRTAPKFNGNVWAQDAYSLQMDAGNRASPDPLGRWPANLIHDGSEEVTALFPESENSIGSTAGSGASDIYGDFERKTRGAPIGRGDSGSAARFFYCAKASREDREEGLADMPRTRRDDGRKTEHNVPNLRTSPARNHHPTVKPTALMRYLVKLVTPPGGIVCDPFMGSGSTGKAAVLEGFRFTGIDIEADYCAIAQRRIEWAMNQPRQESLFPAEKPVQTTYDGWADNSWLVKGGYVEDTE